MLPGNNVLDVVAFESSEGDNIASEKHSVSPYGRVNIDAVVYAGIHTFRLNGQDERIVNSTNSAIPTRIVIFFNKGARKDLIAVWVGSGGGVPSELAHRESVASVLKNRLRAGQGGFDIVMDRGRKCSGRDKRKYVVETDHVSTREWDHRS